MTAKETLASARQRVVDTLQLLQDHGYERLVYDKKKVFFYKQLNRDVCALIYHSNAMNKFGNESKHYASQCFDLFLYMATDVTLAVHQYFHESNQVMDFWIGCLDPYNELHVHVLDVLDSEEGTKPDQLNKKYQTILNQAK